MGNAELSFMKNANDCKFCAPEEIMNVNSSLHLCFIEFLGHSMLLQTISTFINARKKFDEWHRKMCENSLI